MPKLIYLLTEDHFFLSHRLPMAQAAQAAGYDVAVVARVNSDENKNRIEAMGFTLVPLAWRRGSFNPFAAILEVFQIAKIYRDLRPDIVHHLALKPIIWGTFAAHLAGVRCIVNAPTGMGYIFTSRDWLARGLRLVVSPLLRFALRHPDAHIVMENSDDLDELVAGGLMHRDRAMVIRGAGVEMEKFPPMPEPDGPITVGIAARMLHDKGIMPLVEAQQKLRAQGLDIRLLLAGTPDFENRASLTAREMEEIAALPGITALGHVTDIAGLWARCHIAALPSRREGLPKALLEAAAAGRPIVATNVPGCREICRDGENGILVPVDDVDALADALRTLAGDAALRARYGAASRRMAETEFSDTVVGDQIVQLYQKLMASIPFDLQIS